ncbi:MAG: hypothetical protein IB618_02540 [Candidatus Pacearchaeota archaeon]|nr:MAG: hypothetical protein IB618_02540 [Candidatus Pacearchaeota archaeon]
MFIKKIFQNKVDETVHKQFIRFGKGEFGSKAIINIRKTSVVKLTTSFELAGDIIIFISSLAPWFRVEGLLSNREQIPCFEGKKKKGLFVYNIAKELRSEELRDLVLKSYPTLLDCISGDESINLKIKKRIPKPGKKTEAKVDDKFCQLNLDAKYWPQLHNEFLFDLPFEIKKARIVHTFIIKDIKIPKELEKEGDYEKIRLGAKRIGKVIRKVVVDGKEIVKEKDFIA